VVELLLTQKIHSISQENQLSMQMNGAKGWEELTGRAYTKKSNIAIVLDNIVYSAPGVSSGPIAG
jgi:SecD/SecF fusion protein